jgi:hypothetical protein
MPVQGMGKMSKDQSLSGPDNLRNGHNRLLRTVLSFIAQKLQYTETVGPEVWKRQVTVLTDASERKAVAGDKR